MSQAHYVVCRECGTRWTTMALVNPRRCQNIECEAGWLDLPMFVDEADAERAAKVFAGERIAAMREP